MIVGDGLGFEVDGDLVGRGLWRYPVGEEFDVGLGEADEDHAVLAGVGEEDVGEAGGDDDEKAEVGERPGGVLAGAAAAEVLSGDEDLRAGVGGVVEDEGGVGACLRLGAFLDALPVEEEELAVAGALDALEELAWG